MEANEHANEHDYLESMFNILFWNLAVVKKAFPDNPAVKQCTDVLHRSIEECLTDYTATEGHAEHVLTLTRKSA